VFVSDTNTCRTPNTPSIKVSLHHITMQVKFIKQSNKNEKNGITQIMTKDHIIKTRGIYVKELLNE